MDEETRRLVDLFREALALPAVKHAHAAIDCPLCRSEAALTPARIAHTVNSYQIGAAPSTLRETLRRAEAAGLSF